MSPVEDRIAALCQTLLVSRFPYEIASGLHGYGMEGVGSESASKAESDLCYGTWLIWGALTDLWEEASDSTGREAAESEMRLAAAGQITAVRDETVRKEFFDYWLLERFPSPAV